jgi:protein-tyrosine-phosphatase
MADKNGTTPAAGTAATGAPDGGTGGASGLPGSILFVCGLNAIRSPMAETLARAALPRDVFIASAGVQAGVKDPFVEVILGEDGLTAARHQPQSLDELDDSYFDLIITLSPEAHHVALELTRTQPVTVEYWPTSDPSASGDTREQKLAAYRAVREELKRRLEKRFPGPAAAQN